MMVFVDYLLFDPCAGSRVTGGVHSRRLSREIVNELTSWRLMTKPDAFLDTCFVSCCMFFVCLF